MPCGFANIPAFYAHAQGLPSKAGLRLKTKGLQLSCAFKIGPRRTSSDAGMLPHEERVRPEERLRGRLGVQN